MTEIRANELQVGDVFRDDPDDDDTTVSVRDDHGDTVLIITTEGHSGSYDIDQVVYLIERRASR